MNEGMLAVLIIPLASVAAVSALLFYFYKTRQKKLDTLVKVVELGGNVDPDMMKLLSADNGGYKADFRTGLIWLSVGIPLAIGMFLDEGMEAATYGLIPVFIGCAYLIAAKYRLRES